MSLLSDNDDPVLISALEHYVYCPRQCALIHVEQVYDENVYTLQGSHLHARADEVMTTLEGGTRVERALPLWSAVHGLLGRADVVEFRPDGTVYPVEYKRGARRQRAHDDVQLCAQALCLEEMLGVTVTGGAIFYHTSRRQREVALDDPELRRHTRAVIAAVRDLLLTGTMPPPVNDDRCENCSLIEACRPQLLQAAARRDARDALFTVSPEEEDEA